MTMGQECLQLMQKRMGHLITPEEYYSEIVLLNRKYILPLRNKPLSNSDMANYKAQVITKTPDNKGNYLADIEPMNFEEAAQMYVRHRKFIEEHNKPIEKPIFIEKSQPKEEEVPF